MKLRGRTGRKVLIGVGAALLMLAACGGGGDGSDTSEQGAIGVATGFVEAFGAFDAERAVGHLTEFADLSGTDARTPDGLPQLLELLEAQGYRQILEPCREDGEASIGTNVRCPFAFHLIRSDEIGLGPYGGSYFELTVRDGKISDASWHWEIEEFSPEMWEPFRDWVASTYPRDFDVMYVDGGGNFSLSAESIRLWEQRTRQYADEVAS